MQLILTVSKNHYVKWSKLLSDYWFPLYCRYDILVGRSPRMGNATRVSFRSHISLVDDLQPGVYIMNKSKKMSNDYKVQPLLDFTMLPLLYMDSAVTSCGWLSPPTNGKKDGTTYLQGAKVQLSCDDGYTLKGSTERTCQENGLWSGTETSCVAPSMNKWRNPTCDDFDIYKSCASICIWSCVCVCVCACRFFVCIIWLTKSALKLNTKKMKSQKNEKKSPLYVKYTIY